MLPSKFLDMIDDSLAYLAGNGGPVVSEMARIMLLAIAMQESGPMLDARYQNSPAVTPGPARGFWQFERGGGCAGVLTHNASGRVANDMCVRMEVVPTADHVWRAIEGHDRLACIFARMLLWTDPRPLPTNRTEGWDYYIRNWRPGKPHPDRWADNWRVACETVGRREYM